MDIHATAVAAMALLSPYLAEFGKEFAKKTGESLAGKAGELFQAMQAKFKNDKYATETLHRAAEKPDAKGRQDALKQMIVEKMEDDPEFARLIERIISENNTASAAGDVITVTTTISGKTEGDVLIAGKGNVTKQG